MNAADGKKLKDIENELKTLGPDVKAQNEREQRAAELKEAKFDIEYAEKMAVIDDAGQFNLLTSKFHRGRIGGTGKASFTFQPKDGDKATISIDLSDPVKGNLSDDVALLREQFLRMAYQYAAKRANDGLQHFLNEGENSQILHRKNLAS